MIFIYVNFESSTGLLMSTCMSSGLWTQVSPEASVRSDPEEGKAHELGSETIWFQIPVLPLNTVSS